MENYYDCGEGWHSLIEDAIHFVENYNKEHGTNLKFTQIKEKFGGLNLYLDGYIDEVEEYLNAIEEKSYHICERCGSSENVKCEPVHGWYITLCDNCRKNEKRTSKL